MWRTAAGSGDSRQYHSHDAPARDPSWPQMVSVVVVVAIITMINATGGWF